MSEQHRIYDVTDKVIATLREQLQAEGYTIVAISIDVIINIPEGTETFLNIGCDRAHIVDVINLAARDLAELKEQAVVTEIKTPALH